MTETVEPGAPRRRQFFLAGCAAIGAATVGFGMSTLRYLVPTVLYEPPARFTVGAPGDFPPGSVTFLEDRRLFVFNTFRPSGRRLSWADVLAAQPGRRHPTLRPGTS